MLWAVCLLFWNIPVSESLNYHEFFCSVIFFPWTTRSIESFGDYDSLSLELTGLEINQCLPFYDNWAKFLCRASRILRDSIHPRHSLFTLLLSRDTDVSVAMYHQIIELNGVFPHTETHELILQTPLGNDYFLRPDYLFISLYSVCFLNREL